ncbi:MAG: transglycosylase domain-containing protein [Candidatus Eisenbacteria bacterium]|nr:transglycosylase domain-containing protein [Candidatus Eisenbacteria bacterium]
MDLGRLPRPVRFALIALAALVGLALLLPPLLAPWIGARVRSEAQQRGMRAEWRSLAFRWPLTVELRGLTVTRADDATPVLTAGHVEAAVGTHGLTLHPLVRRVVLEDAHIVLPSSSMPDADETDTTPADADHGPSAPRVRAAADQAVQALMIPARWLPTLRVNALTVQRGDSLFARLDAFTVTHVAGGVQLAASGAFTSEREVPFDVAVQWNRDDRLVGRFDFQVPVAEGRSVSMPFVLDGQLHQDRRAGVVSVGDGTKLSLGPVELRLSGQVRRSGPRVQLALETDGVTARALQKHLPHAVLGPLADLPVAGSWDWRASLYVNVDAPDSTRFTADVIPHGLALAGSDAKLRLGRLQGPFLAEIHVPRGIVYRDLSSANPHFRTLDRISPLLQHALLTNEDGGFYRHRGFNTEAIQLAMAANLRSGTFKRGAGTVTMQLARNLFLGHQRTLSRKGQEVVLAWILEHLTGLSKDRLLEIYLNIIEWGPGVHGADEAAQFYFDKNAGELTLDEALFLTVIVPSPSRWKSRVDANGQLRPWARAQMAYIARKMVSREWLAPEQVPSAEALQITLRGEAAKVFTPRDSAQTNPEPVSL